MILARLTHAVREQNWFAVAIEFVIVILGVVIGFQVTAWNATRQDIALERAYLERLSAELAIVQNELEDAQGDLDEARAQAERFLAAYEAGDTDGMQADAFAVLSITRVSEIQIQSAALNELISSGRLGLVRNADLRADLARMPLTEAEAFGVFDQLKAQQVDIIAALRPHIRVTMEDYRVSDIALGDAFSTDDPELANTIAYAIYVSTVASLWVAVLSNEVEELRAELDRELSD